MFSHFLLLSGQISYQCGKIITREELEKILAKEKPEELEVMALQLETNPNFVRVLVLYFWNIINGDRNMYLNIFWDIA